MIPMVTQSRPNVMPRYSCGKCGSPLQDTDRIGSITKGRWGFCPMCGEEVEWEKAKPVEWKEMFCDTCGSQIVYKTAAGMMASSDYIGTSTCRDCQMEHCRRTNCLGCEIGNYPDCKFAYLKQMAMEEEGDEKNE